MSMEITEDIRLRNKYGETAIQCPLNLIMAFAQLRFHVRQTKSVVKVHFRLGDCIRAKRPDSSHTSKFL